LRQAAVIPQTAGIALEAQQQQSHDKQQVTQQTYLLFNTAQESKEIAVLRL
jgi:hypothetical protein